MKLAVLSDLHLGDPICALIKQTDTCIETTEYYEKLKSAVGTDNDYLIILGDLFDIAVRDYEDVYTAAAHFFECLKRDNIAKEIIYVPGNHDYSIWHTLEHQINVIDRMQKKELPRQFKQNVPGLLDLRSNSSSQHFRLQGVSRKAGEHPYGDIYLKNVNLLNNPDFTEPTFFNIAYPNLYLVTDEGSYLFTHGQYFESFWNLASEWLPKVAANDPEFGPALKNMTLKESIAVNFPLGQLGSSGFGQAGILTDLVRKVQNDVTSKNGSLINEYVKNLIEAMELGKGERWFKRFLIWLLKPFIIDIIQGKITKAVRAYHSSIYQELKEQIPVVLNRFVSYTEKSQQELAQFLSEEHIPLENGTLKALYFGHTHMPLPLQEIFSYSVNGTTIPICNTGGWVNIPDGDSTKFCGA